MNASRNACDASWSFASAASVVPFDVNTPLAQSAVSDLPSPVLRASQSHSFAYGVAGAVGMLTAGVAGAPGTVTAGAAGAAGAAVVPATGYCWRSSATMAS